MTRFSYSFGGTVAEFFERNLRHFKGPAAGKPFALEPFQRDFIDEFYRCDENGKRLYREALVGIPRGNGKTPLAAGLGLRDLRTRRDSPDVFCGAAAKEQGGILLEFAKGFVETGPLVDRIAVQRNLLRCERTRGLMQVVSADGSLQHGKSVSGWYGDEYHAFHTQKQRELHVAMRTAIFKRDDAASLAITTAGWDKSTLLGEMFDGAMRDAVEMRDDGYLMVVRDEQNGSLFWWRQVPDGADIEDPAVIKRANPASWVDVNDLLVTLRSNTSGIGELEFRRLHCNQWTSAQAQWIPLDAWLGGVSDEEPGVDAEIYVAVDASTSHDTTAVAWAWRTENGRIGLRAHVWSPRDTAPAHEYEPTKRIRMEAVREFIHDLEDKYTIRQVAFDPAYFHDTAETLSEQGFYMVQLDQQTKVMRDAEQQFHDAVMEGRIVHNDDPIVRQHLVSVVASRRPNGAWKIRPLDQVKAIDATVAMVMAHSRALHSPTRSAPLFEVLA